MAQVINTNMASLNAQRNLSSSQGDFNTALQVFLDKNQSPLVWIKHPNGNTERVFVVWW